MACYEVVTDDGIAVQDGRIVGQHLVYLSHNLLGTLLRSTGVSRHSDEDGTRILIRHKAGVGELHAYNKCHDAHNNDSCRDETVIEDMLNTFFILVKSGIEHPVEAGMETRDERLVLGILLFLMRLEQHSAECRRQSEGVDCRYDDGHCHRNAKLSIECT